MAKLRVERPETTAPAALPDRGRLIGAKEIIRRHFAHLDEPVSEEWVRDTVPHKVRISHTRVAWFERDVEAWLESLRQEDAA